MKPSEFQTKTWWAALTALAFVILIGVAVAIVRLVSSASSILQPVLLPVAIAAILAYLLDPVVTFICRKGLSRFWGTTAVFAAFALILTGALIWLVPAIQRQTVEFVNNFPTYSARFEELMAKSTDTLHRVSESQLFRAPVEGETRDAFTTYASQVIKQSADWLQAKIPDVAVVIGDFLGKSIGVVGVLLSFLLIPIFLFFFLKDGPSIAARWSNYLPLRASPLKNEIVSLLSEINGYLIAFFRGQLMVSLIDGAITGILLLIVGLDFALLLGLLVGILGVIPYAGVVISWIPAVIISAAQFGDWMHPLIVTAIFLLVHNLDSIFISPHVVGESVGLRPLTVIISVLAWTLLVGGILGALLAVPLTATLKVVARRYIWDKPTGLERKQ